MTSSTSGWSGIWMSPTMVSKQAAAWGKTVAMRSSERVRWICGAMRLPLDKRRSCRLRSAAQRQRFLKMGEAMRGLLEELLGGVFGEELEDVGEGEAVLLGEGDVDAVVGGGGLQFEVEAAAEAFAQGESEGLVDAAAEGSVQDELHAAAVVEEALGDDGGLGGHGSEDGAAGDDVGDELLCAARRRRRSFR